jgi:uncharacterized protein YndB with AHSA1/START domain
MTAKSAQRIDSASRVVKASPQSIYQAYLDPDALASWVPPKGMKARIDAYDRRAGGRYRLVLTYDEPGQSARGKTSEDSDVINGRFLELVPDERIVQLVEFDSEDPAFTGEMKLTWTFRAARTSPSAVRTYP